MRVRPTIERGIVLKYKCADLCGHGTFTTGSGPVDLPYSFNYARLVLRIVRVLLVTLVFKQKHRTSRTAKVHPGDLKSVFLQQE